MSYNPKSMHAEEFIDDTEILECIEYAKKNKSNKEVVNAILEKAKLAKGISHKEAAVLMECDIPECNEEMRKIAIDIKENPSAHPLFPLRLSPFQREKI